MPLSVDNQAHPDSVSMIKIKILYGASFKGYDKASPAPFWYQGGILASCIREKLFKNLENFTANQNTDSSLLRSNNEDWLVRNSCDSIILVFINPLITFAPNLRISTL